MRFHGIIPPVVTLFDEDGNLDLDLNKRYLDELINEGVHGILLMGSTGEFTSLTMEERKLYVKEMTKHINQRVPVLVGIGHTALCEVLNLCTFAEEQGADAVLAVNPYYWPLSEEQLYGFYGAIAENTSLPVILYNIPSLSGQSLSADLVKKLSIDYQNICGIKETINDFGHIRQMIKEVTKVRSDFMVFTAFDEHLLPGQMIGTAGSINGTASFAPEISVSLYEEYRNGNLAKAEQQHRKLSHLMDIYTLCPSFFIAVKEAVHQRWFRVNAGNLPPFDIYPKELSDKVTALLQTIETKVGSNNERI
ncbi:dihydrodipicolinate synthase family protein [Cytobacillus oceanisediminis]|uniref:dihydrodipicolinate synthase family protein n=1 Tax=Cytobacillus oceanisediminis TaxID=665099 RepID=UPI0023DCC061|nr:dihydrodipicolinate synthase family protein [Cytobacillus oceanisediminis]MDF2040268.1 dihydrodipicolinate synthase family protein [Cytobacillus oceanisediminis]